MIIVIVNLLVLASLLAVSLGKTDAVIVFVFDVIGVFYIVFVVFIAVADAFEVF